MTKITLLAVVLVAITLGFPAHRLMQKNRALTHQLEQKDKQINQVQIELTQVKHLLETSEQKLGYLAAHKTPVQVTAFCKQPHSNRFANGHSVHSAYAVKKRTLPDDVIVNVALSPTTQRRLNARMGDLIVIMDKNGHRKTVARFVDTTFAGESRAVIDVYFANPENARHWGRKDGYYAVNISGKASPFKVN